MPTPEGKVGLLHTFDLVTCMSLHVKEANKVMAVMLGFQISFVNLGRGVKTMYVFTCMCTSGDAEISVFIVLYFPWQNSS